jgi:hypothetical protein
MARNEDGSVKDDGTLYGYYASRRENRQADQAKREAEAAEAAKNEKKRR